MKATKTLLVEIAEALELIKARVGRLHDLDGAGNPEASLRHCADAMMLVDNVGKVLLDLSDRYSKALWKQQKKAQVQA